MIQPLALGLQTAYADLLEKVQDADFQHQTQGAPAGSFQKKTIKGRNYWYAQVKDSMTGRYKQKYIGPETPDLLHRINEHKAQKENARLRRDLVRALTRSGAVPIPNPAISQVIRELALSGIFGLRAVLVGTVAYQTYGPMIGVKLGATASFTEDVDIAQFRSISIAVDDSIPAILGVLKNVVPSFEPVTKTLHDKHTISYISGSIPLSGGRQERLKVEFLTPMRGPEEDGVGLLPALGTAAQPLRFLDFLIYQEQKALILDRDGILVNVPDPTRYALHKLIVSQRRSNIAKSQKDIKQADFLLDALTDIRPNDVSDYWDEFALHGRQKWQKIAWDAISTLSPQVQAKFQHVIGRSAPS